jgi:hypothetical protein
MANAVNTNNQMIPTNCFQDLPEEVMTQIFSRLTPGAKLQVREVCQYWERVFQVAGKEDIREIRAVHKIAISILNENGEYPVYFQVKVYREIAQAKQLDSSPKALGNIAYYLISRGYSQDALNVLNCCTNESNKIEILARTVALLATENQFTKVTVLENAIRKEESRTISALATQVVATAIRILLAFDQDHIAEALFNHCWMANCNSQYEKISRLIYHFNNMQIMNEPTILTMVQKMIDRERTLLTSGPGQA